MVNNLYQTGQIFKLAFFKETQRSAQGLVTSILVSCYKPKMCLHDKMPLTINICLWFNRKKTIRRSSVNLFHRFCKVFSENVAPAWCNCVPILVSVKNLFFFSSHHVYSISITLTDNVDTVSASKTRLSSFNITTVSYSIIPIIFSLESLSSGYTNHVLVIKHLCALNLTNRSGKYIQTVS